MSLIYKKTTEYFKELACDGREVASPLGTEAPPALCGAAMTGLKLRDHQNRIENSSSTIDPIQVNSEYQLNW